MGLKRKYMIYQSLITGGLMKLVKERESGVDTFVECDASGIPTVKRRNWTIGKQVETQPYLVKKPYNGKLIIYNNNPQLTLEL